MDIDDDPHAEGPVCDFCKIAVDADEELEPIFVGEQPEPNTHYLQATAQRGGASYSQYKGKYKAIRKALYDCPDVKLSESNVVHEVRDSEGESQILTEEEMWDVPSATKSIRRRNRVAATIRIRPKSVETTPDAEVCDVCAEMFQSLGDG